MFIFSVCATETRVVFKIYIYHNMKLITFWILYTYPYANAASLNIHSVCSLTTIKSRSHLQFRNIPKLFSISHKKFFRFFGEVKEGKIYVPHIEWRQKFSYVTRPHVTIITAITDIRKLQMIGEKVTMKDSYNEWCNKNFRKKLSQLLFFKCHSLHGSAIKTTQ
jgi:hypothetical protein